MSYKAVVYYSMGADYCAIVAEENELREVRDTILEYYIDKKPKKGVHKYNQVDFLPSKNKDSLVGQLIHTPHDHIGNDMSHGTEINGILVSLSPDDLNDKKVRKSTLQRLVNAARKEIR